MRLILLILILSFLHGCVLITKPKNDVEFSNITEVQELVGCYQNLAEGENSNAKIYLTQFIWKDINHKEVEIVRVIKIDGKSLKVIGEKNKKILYKEIFTEGKDFTLEDGKITIKSKIFGSLAGESGNPFIGVIYESVTLGLDKNEDGKLKHNGTLAGTAFIIIPMAGYISDSYRFKRIKKGCLKANKYERL